MNYAITHALNSLTGTSVFLDALVFVYAEFIPWIVGLIFCLFIVFSYRHTIKPFVFSALVLAGAGIVNALLKLVFDFKRPFEVYQSIEPLFYTYGFGSFPSSHAFFFAVLATLSCFFLRRISFFFVIVTFLIGIARIIAGVHFFFDIIAGWILGFLLAFIAMQVYKKSIGRED